MPVTRGFRSGAYRSGLVDSAAQGVDFVARPGRLLGGCPRRTSPRRPHRLAAPREPLWMVVARIRLELNPHRGIGILRSLLPISGAGSVARSSGGKRDAGGVGMGGGDSAVALPVAAVPHGSPAIAALASPSMDRFGGGSDGRYSRPIRRRGKPSNCRRGDGDRCREHPLGALLLSVTGGQAGSNASSSSGLH